MNTATPTAPAAAAGSSFDPDAYLASPVVPTIDFVPDPVQPDPSSGWQVVPATARCAEGYTIEDYEQAAESLRQDGDEQTATQATQKAWQMRRWLVTALGNHRN